MKLCSSSLSVIRVVSSAYLRLWKSKLQKISCVSSIWIRLFQQQLVSNLCVKLQSVCFHSVVPSIFLVRLPSFSSKSQWVIATLLLQTKIKKEIISLYAVAIGEGNGTPLQYSCLENPMDGGAWWAAVHGVAKSQTRLNDFTFTSHFRALEKEMATHSSVLAWRIPGTGEPSRLPSMGSHRVGHDWSDLAAAAACSCYTTN